MTPRSRRLAGILVYCGGVSLLSLSAGIVMYGPSDLRAAVLPAAWTGLLLALGGLNAALSGESLLLSESWRFLGLYALSVPFWLSFELLNFRVKDWAYEGMPADVPLRWATFALVFGAMLPLFVELRKFLEFALPLKQVPGRPFRLTEGGRDTLRVLGLACLSLPLLWPAKFSLLLWAFPVLLLEPSLSRDQPLDSVFFDMSMGSAEALLSSLGACLLGMGLWGAVNAWSGARWVPRSPLADWSLFPLFGLACAGVAVAAGSWWERLSVGARASAVFFLSAYSTAVLIGMDSYTVR